MNTEMIFVVVALLLSILGLILVSCLALFYRQKSATRTEYQCQYGRKCTYRKLLLYFIRGFGKLSQRNAHSPQSHL